MNTLMKIFFLPLLIISGTTTLSQQKPSDRSFTSQIIKAKERQRAAHKMIQQNQQMLGQSDSSQNNNSSIQLANSANNTNSIGINKTQAIPVSNEKNRQPTKVKPSSRPIQFPEKLRKTGSGG